MEVKNNSYIMSIFLTVILTGCSESHREDLSDQKMMAGESRRAGLSGLMTMARVKQKANSDYLAYEHHLSVDIAKEKIQKTYQTVVNSCAADEKYQCTILHSSINTGNHTSSNIRLRIKPDGVSYIVDLASTGGEISNQSTDVEDLGDAVVDNKKRLEMLRQYQSRLEALEQKSEQDVESLIKLASELSSVQANLEYAEGKKAQLLQRVQMDIVNISLFSRASLSFWQPISESMNEFGSNLSEGISQIVTAVAFLIPWIVIIIFAIYVIRLFWRRSKTDSKRVITEEPA